MATTDKYHGLSKGQTVYLAREGHGQGMALRIVRLRAYTHFVRAEVEAVEGRYTNQYDFYNEAFQRALEAAIAESVARTFVLNPSLEQRAKFAALTARRLKEEVREREQWEKMRAHEDAFDAEHKALVEAEPTFSEPILVSDSPTERIWRVVSRSHRFTGAGFRRDVEEKVRSIDVGISNWHNQQWSVTWPSYGSNSVTFAADAKALNLLLATAPAAVAQDRED